MQLDCNAQIGEACNGSYFFVPARRCGKTIRQTTIDLHPTRAVLAIHNFECVDCGPVKSKVYSLKPGKYSPELAA